MVETAAALDVVEWVYYGVKWLSLIGLYLALVYVVIHKYGR